MPAEFVNRFAIQNITGAPEIAPGTESNIFAIPISGLAEVSKGVTVVEFKNDDDGVNRRTRPLREYQGKYYPILGLAPFINETSSISFRTVPFLSTTGTSRLMSAAITSSTCTI